MGLFSMSTAHSRLIAVVIIAGVFIGLGVVTNWYDGALSSTVERDRQRRAFCKQRCRAEPPGSCANVQTCSYVRCVHRDVALPITYNNSNIMLCKDNVWKEAKNHFVDFREVRDFSPIDLPSITREPTPVVLGTDP